MHRRIALRAREISVPPERKVPAVRQMCPVRLRHPAVMRVVWLGVSVVRWVRRVVNGVVRRVLPVLPRVRYVVNGPLFVSRVPLEPLLAGQVAPPGEFPLLPGGQLVPVHRMLRARLHAVRVALLGLLATIRVRALGCVRRNVSDVSLRNNSPRLGAGLSF